MSNPFIAGFEPDAHDAFLDAGIADPGTFAAQGGAAVPCKVMVDRDPVTVALAGFEITKDQALIRLLCAGIATTPRNGDVITVGAETYTVAKREKSDAGSWVLICQA